MNPLLFRRLTINGKFLTARPTGVHRVADQLIRQIVLNHDILDGVFRSSPAIVAPRSASEGTHGVQVERYGRLRGQLWEQMDLPRAARSDLLLNLCNLGPVGLRNAITMIHDAQVFITPQSYSVAFRTWYKTILPLIGRRHRRILTVSHFSAEQLVRAGVTDAERISVIHNGVDHVLQYPRAPEIINRLSLERRRFVVALSSTQAHKNIKVLLDAFSSPELCDIKLVLFGGHDRRDFERLYSHVPANVVFAGPVTDGELRSLYEAALCVGFPSTTEGFGLPPLEGMALGCPAVVAPCGALPEVAGQGALYAAAGNPREWGEAIKSLAASPPFWLERSVEAAAQAANFTWRKAGADLCDVIRLVADDRQRMPGWRANGSD
ncbi:glycosyltransferase family 1 protein [Rhodopseudomonas palustris]|uniref:Glycosyltransferase family 1 protein n=1 Tax=Rhodopseudomonas palustris TaxID=1076 RepID=A0A323UKS8_RHOPL|nr:glycosyltransferase family 1 protein [Rhodopseudomonas palustris]PZA12817.1 glycosyltransferase family 1 protein [Rhodopseudomonas palustris]